MLSILDTDLYKFSMSNAYLRLYPLAEGTFTFNDRNKESYDEEFVNQLKYELAKLNTLKLTDGEFDWCVNNIRYIPESYWEWLRQFKFDLDKINVFLDDEGVLQINVTDKLYKVTLYEIPVLATVAELRNRYRNYKCSITDVVNIIDKKINFANEYHLKFSDFGTRRRYSAHVQETVIKELAEKCPIYCPGTSNVYLAMKYNMIPVGTMAHEWIMFHAGVFGFQRANYLSMEDWVKVYDGDLGTALIDTYTTDSFLRTLTCKQAKLFDGFRQDSGDEFIIGNKIIDRLKEFGIDPKSKTIVFSNALTLDKYKDIVQYFNGRINVAAGIGTNITSDVGIKDYRPANIVMKLSRVRMSSKDPWENVVKISDDTGKHMGDSMKLEIARNELHLNF